MKMRATSEAAPLYSNKLWYGSSFHDRNLANGDTQSFRVKPNGVCLANIEVWGNVDRARRRNMRIGNLEKEGPTRVSSLDSCERI